MLILIAHLKMMLVSLNEKNYLKLAKDVINLEIDALTKLKKILIIHLI